MSEELDIGVQAPEIAGVEPAQAELSEAPKKTSSVEDKAREGGWVPKEEFKGNPEDWRSAEVFLERGPLMDRIKKLNKDMEKLVSLSEQSEKKAKQAEINAFKRYQDELAQMRQRAIEEGDAQSIDAISRDLHQAQIQEQFLQQQAAPPIQEEVQSFVNKHQSTWLNDANSLNSSMKLFAINKENEIRAQNPSLPLIDVLNLVEKEVEYNFSHHPAFAGKSRPSPVMGATASERSDSKVGYTIHDLPDNAKPIFRMIENIKKKAKQSYTVKDFIETYGQFNQEKR